MQGFVGVLDTQAALFVWDQLFMQLWNSRIMVNTCLVLLLLLRPKFMAARDYSAMRKVSLCIGFSNYIHYKIANEKCTPTSAFICQLARDYAATLHTLTDC